MARWLIHCRLSNARGRTGLKTGICDPAVVLDFIHGKQAITSLRHFMPGESEEAIQQQFSLLEKVEAEDTDGISALPGAGATA